MIIGIVGKSGSGKNHLINKHFAFSGFTHFDLDVHGHKVLKENIKEIGKVFYGNAYSNAVDISREDIAKIVFKNKRALNTLEYITHPIIEERVMKDLVPDSLLNGAVLHKSGLLKKCDYVIYVKSPLWKRVYRLCKRDNKSIMHILRRIYSQREISPILYTNCLIVNN